MHGFLSSARFPIRNLLKVAPQPAGQHIRGAEIQVMAEHRNPQRRQADETTTLGYGQLCALLERIFLRAGASPDVATILASNCAACERDGSISHGIFRVPGYVSSIASGWVDPKAEPALEDVGAAFLRVDAMNGFAQPALAAARDLAIEKTRRAGASVLAIRNSHHFSALWPDVEPFAREGLVAISMVNSFACAVPHGGRKAVFGTNPIAYAAPRAGGLPLVADLATSSMANGDVQIAAREGRTLPAGYAVDANGAETTDPNVVLESGALRTFGGHKGSAISLMIELFGAALTGGDFSFEVDWSGHPGAQTPHTGQLVILVDPDKGRPHQFAQRAEHLVEQLLASGLDRLPGTRRYETRARADRSGIPISNAALESLEQLAK